jgi:hypothetical protein
MNIDFAPLFFIGLALVVAVLLLALTRRIVAKQEDDTLHVLAGPGVIQHQVALAHRLAVIDRWGIALTIATAAYVVAVFVLFECQYWLQSSRMP